MHPAASHQPAALWKDTVPDRLRHSLLCIADTLSCPRTKVKCFSRKDSFFLSCTKSNDTLFKKLEKLPVDKPWGLWFNDIRTYLKDVDGNLASSGHFREPAGGVSRCEKRMQSASRVGSVNRVHLSVMEPGRPRYRDRTCWSLKGSPPLGR